MNSLLLLYEQTLLRLLFLIINNATTRKPSGKKPGAQKGHKAHTATKLTAPKEPVVIPAPASFALNSDLYPTGKKITKQLIDISISVNVTNFITDEYRNRKTGARCHAPFPTGIINDVNYGSMMQHPKGVKQDLDILHPVLLSILY